MKIIAGLLMLSLAACSNGRFIFKEIAYEKQFKCDMDPLMQQCERRITR